MSDIKLNIKLSAYSKGVIPDVSKFIEDAPMDGNTYGRVDGKWYLLDIPTQADSISTTENSGINIDRNEYNVTISAKQ